MGNRRINWARGFFRLWVLVSLLWIATVTTFMWSSISNPYVAPHVFIGPEGDVAWAAHSNQARAARELKARGEFVEVEVDGAPNITYLGRDNGNLAEIMEQKAPVMVGFYKTQVSTGRASAVWQTVSVGLIPPAIILVIGFFISWAMRGFLHGRDMDAT
ncbi:hypothetical protein [Chelativorans sp. J32]|uniref:hypothetical protein n=1 Tax=Chelativorans sp. J32 TaxID=935840 RepID=UPI0012EC10A2|nr:hypothetical protein [Chelativorans sp. J32]